MTSAESVFTKLVGKTHLGESSRQTGTVMLQQTDTFPRCFAKFV